MGISKQDLIIIGRLRDVTVKSHDPDRPVGVIIANNAGVPLASGTNAPPAPYGYTLEQTHAAISEDPSWKYFMLEHAERNAISQAHNNGVSLEGSTIYGSLFPCADCARAIAAAGIKRAVFPAPGIHPLRDEKWRDHYRYAQKIFELSDIELALYKSEETEID